MPYTPTTWVDNVTDGNHTTMNNLETQYTEATLSFERDLFASFVLNGLVCTKDGSIANQLDYTTGTFFITQADNTLRRRNLAAGSFTTSAPSSSYFFDVNPDGSTSWGTSHSAVTNHMNICNVTTDDSGNILVVTDARQTQVELLNLAAGGLFWNNDFHLSGALFGNSGVVTIGDALKLTGGFGGGVPVVGDKLVRHNVTTTTLAALLSYPPPTTGIYRVNAYVWFGAGSNQDLTLQVAYKDPDSGSSVTFFMHTISGTAMDGTNSFTHGAGLQIESDFFAAASSANIVVSYQDPGGSPNDFVSITIEQLA